MDQNRQKWIKRDQRGFGKNGSKQIKMDKKGSKRIKTEQKGSKQIKINQKRIKMDQNR